MQMTFSGDEEEEYDEEEVCNEEEQKVEFMLGNFWDEVTQFSAVYRN